MHPIIVGGQGRLNIQMGFTHYDLGYQSRGTVVEVSLSGSAANVRLLDSSDFQHYRSGRRHSYYGGLIRRSPAHLAIPHSGHWHVTVDMQGLRRTTRSSIRLIPQASLSPLPEYSPRPLTRLVQPVIPEAPTGEHHHDQQRAVQQHAILGELAQQLWQPHDEQRPHDHTGEAPHAPDDDQA